MSLPPTPAEAWASRQCTVLDSLFARPAAPFSRVPYGNACNVVDTLDAFDTTLSGEFLLDEPLRIGWFRQLALTQPDAAAQLMVVSAGTSTPASPARAATPAAPARPNLDTEFERALQELKKSATDWTNLPGNAQAAAEAALRAAWRRQAQAGFQALLSAQAPSVRIGRHIVIEARKIGQGGVLRAGARLQVRITQLPLAVIQQLPSPVVLKARGSVGSIRVGARDMAGLNSAAQTIAHTRVQSSRLLRGLSSKAGGGVLAFGPSAANDFYNSARWTGSGLEVNWKGFAVASAKSQSGNLVGFASGAAVGAAAVALGAVSAVGAPVILIGLGAGLVAQALWGWSGADEAAAQAVQRGLQ
ncbi:MAG: hypothetical protein ACOVOG_10265 [Rubrivivax sp.]|jgi:hypothetical protein|nr:hypothetical protein [Rubrivivax sp.]